MGGPQENMAQYEETKSDRTLCVCHRGTIISPGYGGVIMIITQKLLPVLQCHGIKDIWLLPISTSKNFHVIFKGISVQ